MSVKMNQATLIDGELEYEIRGNGEPVLFIHGALIADSLRALMNEPSLAKYCLIRYHRRGHVGSLPPEGPFRIEEEAVTALALLQHLGIKQTHVVGYSSGGAIAIQLALDVPDVVHSLVLIEPALATGRTRPSERMASLIERYQAGDISGAVDAFLKSGSPEWKSVINRVIPDGSEQAKSGAKAFFEVEIPAMLQWRWDDGRAAQIAQPVLYVNQSGRSWEEKKQRVRNWFPKAEYHLVDNVTHSLPMEDPKAVAVGISDFLDQYSF